MIQSMKSLSEGEEDVETGDAPEKPTGLAKSDSSMSTTSNEPSIPRLIRRDASETPTRLVKTDSIMSTVRDGPVPAIPRMVRRDLPAFQSNNRFVVKHKLTRELWFLLRHDWFHVVLNQPAPLSILILLIFWTLVILVFAAVYIRIDRASPETFCGLGINNEPFSMASAFAFSLETATTVGYGLPNGTNSFFSNCPGLQTVIYFQMVYTMMFNAFLFAFFYTSLAKSSSRGIQVLFSRKAIISDVGDQVRFQIRIYDLDPTHPVVEAHVRIYAWTKHQPVPRPLRLLQPNDETGALLFMSMPVVVTHHVDAYSMLHPPTNVDFPVDPSGLVLRQCDSAIGSREEYICPVCGESYGTHERWVNHVRYSKILDGNNGYPVAGCHLRITEEQLKKPEVPISDIETLKKYFEDEMAEILCVVEGIDPLMSGTFQALQSYGKDDIVWDKGAFFRPCLNVDGSSIEINLDDFHEVEHDNISVRDDPPPRNPNSSSFRRPSSSGRLRRNRMISRRKHDSFFVR